MNVKIYACNAIVNYNICTYLRPPGIYKQDYIVELFQRYSDEEPILAPELPDWCLGDYYSHNKVEFDIFNLNSFK